MREKLKEFIENDLGYKVIGEAADGEEGIAKFKELKPDFTVLDLYMPVLTGRDALIQLMDYEPDAKIMMTSSKGTPEIIESCMDEGALAYVVKPYLPERTRETFQKVFDSVGC